MIWLLIAMTVIQVEINGAYYPARVCHYASEDLQKKKDYMIPMQLVCPTKIVTQELEL
jgi:hypothetical protein